MPTDHVLFTSKTNKQQVFLINTSSKNLKCELISNNAVFRTCRFSCPYQEKLQVNAEDFSWKMLKFVNQNNSVTCKSLSCYERADAVGKTQPIPVLHWGTAGESSAAPSSLPVSAVSCYKPSNIHNGLTECKCTAQTSVHLKGPWLFWMSPLQRVSKTSADASQLCLTLS